MHLSKIKSCEYYQNARKTLRRKKCIGRGIFRTAEYFLILQSCISIKSLAQEVQGKNFFAILQFLIKQVNSGHFQDCFTTFMRIFHQILIIDKMIVFLQSLTAFTLYHTFSLVCPFFFFARWVPTGIPGLRPAGPLLHTSHS